MNDGASVFKGKPLTTNGAVKMEWPWRPVESVYVRLACQRLLDI